MLFFLLDLLVFNRRFDEKLFGLYFYVPGFTRYIYNVIVKYIDLDVHVILFEDKFTRYLQISLSYRFHYVCILIVIFVF